MWLTFTSAVLTAALVFITGYYYGALGVSVTYFFVTGFVSLPFGFIIWYRCRHEWHSDGFAESELAQYGGL
jgi:O-antigen/teichoic acid export membrane protein